MGDSNNAFIRTVKDKSVKDVPNCGPNPIRSGIMKPVSNWMEQEHEWRMRQMEYAHQDEKNHSH